MEVGLKKGPFSFFSRIVENGLMSSTFGNCDPLGGNVGFSVGEFDNHTMDVLGCLRLGYRTDWPCNIILTNDAVAMYGEIFQFLLQLRKAVWAMEQVYVGLKGMSKGKNKIFHLF